MSALALTVALSAGVRAQEITRPVGRLGLSGDSIIVSATSQGLLAVWFRNAAWSVPVFPTPAGVRHWIAEADSISRISANPIGDDVLTFSGPILSSARGALRYSRSISGGRAAEHEILALNERFQPDITVRLTSRQLAQFLVFLRRSADLTDSLSAKH